VPQEPSVEERDASESPLDGPRENDGGSSGANAEAATRQPDGDVWDVVTACGMGNPGCCGYNEQGCQVIVVPALCVSHEFTCSEGTSLGPGCEPMCRQPDANAPFTCNGQPCNATTSYCILTVQGMKGVVAATCPALPAACVGLGGDDLCSCLEENSLQGQCALQGGGATITEDEL
jgi:hypothetical protein